MCRHLRSLLPILNCVLDQAAILLLQRMTEPSIRKRTAIRTESRFRLLNSRAELVAFQTRQPEVHSCLTGLETQYLLQQILRLLIAIGPLIGIARTLSQNRLERR